MTVTVDRRREEQAYDLRLMRDRLTVVADSPVGRILAAGIAAIGSRILIATQSTDGRRTQGNGYLVAGSPSGAPSDPLRTFVEGTIRHWFPDATMHIGESSEPIMMQLLESVCISQRQLPFVVVPAENTELVTKAYEIAAREDVEEACIRIVAHGPRGVCIAIPNPEQCREQLRAMRSVMEGSPGEDPLSLDTALIAAGLLMHEARLFAGATVGGRPMGESLDDEQFAEDTCVLHLPDPVPEQPRSAVCVGAGGLGSILAIFGVAPSAGPGQRMTLVDGDHVESHNLLLSPWAGEPKVRAVQAEMQRYGAHCEIDTIAEMVGEDTRLPEADVYYAVTDSMPSRALARSAMPEGTRSVLVCSGSSLNGAEAFQAGRGAACVTCRFPHAGGPARCDDDECNRAVFASNMSAAGFALALGRRVGNEDFRDSQMGLSRFGISTVNPSRFNCWLPQTCEHYA